MLTLIVTSACAGLIALFDRIYVVEIPILVFGFASFVVLFGLVPSRLLRHSVAQQKDCIIESKRTLIRYLSHEIRSPLSVAKGMLVLSSDELGMSRLPAESNTIARAYLKDVKYCVDIAINVVDDLLNFDTMEDGMFVIEPRLTSTRSLYHVINNCRSFTQQKNLHFVINDRLLFNNNNVEGAIYIDLKKIEQLFSNLLLNISEFTKEKGNISVVISSEECKSEQQEYNAPDLMPKKTIITQLFENLHCYRGKCNAMVMSMSTGPAGLDPLKNKVSDGRRKVVIELCCSDSGRFTQTYESLIKSNTKFDFHSLQG
jgi:signal transduction histidine kinase